MKEFLNIKTNEIELRKLKESYFDHLIRQEHYLHRANSTQPAIHYGFYYEDQLVALQEWSAIFKPILLRFPFVHHLEIVDNSRFLVRKEELREFNLFAESIPNIYNLGSRCLSIGIKNIIKDWFETTNIKLRLLITYVDTKRGYDGTVYKASNWKEIENSAGKNLTKNPKKGGTVLIDYKPTPKKTFIYRLDKSFRCNPVTKFKNVFLKRHWKELNSVAQYNYKPKKG